MLVQNILTSQINHFALELEKWEKSKSIIDSHDISDYTPFNRREIIAMKKRATYQVNWLKREIDEKIQLLVFSNSLIDREKGGNL